MSFQVNDVQFTFWNNDSIPSSYFALFPNFEECRPSHYGFSDLYRYPFYGNLISSLNRVPSQRVIPLEYFMFFETHWGGCRLYTQTDSRGGLRGVLAGSIGFRWTNVWRHLQWRFSGLQLRNMIYYLSKTFVVIVLRCICSTICRIRTTVDIIGCKMYLNYNSKTMSQVPIVLGKQIDDKQLGKIETGIIIVAVLYSYVGL